VIEVTKKFRNIFGACNYCDKGKVNAKGNGLTYPYGSIYEVQNDKGGISVRFCKECLKELHTKISEVVK